MGFAIQCGSVLSSTVMIGEGGFYFPAGAGNGSTSFLAVVPFAPVSANTPLVQISDWIQLISTSYIYGGNGGYGPVGGNDEIDGAICWGMTWVGVTPSVYPFPATSAPSDLGGRCTFQVIVINNPSAGVGAYTLEINVDTIGWSNPSPLAALTVTGFYNVWGSASDQQYAFIFPGGYYNGPNGAPVDPAAYANGYANTATTALVAHSFQSSVLGRYDFGGPQLTLNLSTFPNLITSNPPVVENPSPAWTLPTGELTGLVTADAVDVEGATVALYTHQSSTTPSHGVYLIDDIIIGDYDSIITCPTYAPQIANVNILPFQSTTQNFSLTTSTSTFITGWVLDPATGLPIAGATVTATTANELPVSTVSGLGGGFILTVPNINATWTVCTTVNAGTPTNCISVVTVPGETSGPVMIPTGVPASNSGDSSVFGYITKYQGAVIGGATVAVSNYSGYSATSAMSGLYNIEALPPLTVTTLVAIATGYRNAYSTFLTPYSSSAQIDIGMLLTSQTVGTISGTVTDADDNPLQGVYVCIQGLVGTLSTATGYYALSGVPTGTNYVQAILSGYVPSEASAVVTSGNTTTLNFTLDAISQGQCAIYGMCVDAVYGTPISGAQIKTPTVSTTSNPDGSYILSGLPCPPYAITVSASASAYRPNTIPNIPLTQGQLIDLNIGLISLTTPVGLIEGYAFDSYFPNTRLGGALISLGPYLETIASNLEGEYSIVVPANIVWTGTAFAQSYLPCVINDQEVAEGGDLEVDYPMVSLNSWTNLGSLTVTVLDAVSQNPIGGAEVSIAYSLAATQQTNASGVASFTEIPSGQIGVIAAAQGYVPGLGFATVTNVAPGTLTISLYGYPAWLTGGILYGFALAIGIGNGLGIAGAVITTDPNSYAGWAVLTNAYGAYIILNIPAGTYSASCNDTNYDEQTVNGIIISAQVAVEQNYYIPPWDGAIPVGWRILQVDPVQIEGNMESIVMTLDMPQSTIAELEANVTALAVNGDTTAYGRYRRCLAIGANTPIPNPGPIVTTAWWIAPDTQIAGPSTLAIPVNTNPALFPPGTTIPVPPAPTPYTSTTTAYSEALQGVKDGENTVFTSANAPTSLADTQLFVNGVLEPQSYYSVSGNLWTLSVAPLSTDTLLATYTSTGAV